MIATRRAPLFERRNALRRWRNAVAALTPRSRLRANGGFARDVAGLGGSYDKAVSSLVFHQVPLAGKREGVAAMFASIRPGGEVHIADYAHQSGALMRALFRLTVQGIDGLADTQPNADGALESILSDYDEAAVAPQAVVPTATGAISLFKAIKPFRN